jgi:hypothetical protein
MQTRSSKSPPTLQQSLSDHDPVKAYWDEDEEAVLLEYLLEAKNQGKMSGTGFKDNTLNGAAVVLNQRRRKGAEKTGNSCRTKWTSVRPN